MEELTKKLIGSKRNKNKIERGGGIFLQKSKEKYKSKKLRLLFNFFQIRL